ncbi:hypothetical protein B0T16DRAFT_226563 [Cercophora newfieldiana]|uniref:DUF7779 domain-containing protein n=1 Tax=Cercophora newfieldiana TaxID=92897 RepID=A0AA39XRT9_9PEZI|nr:hypothetical protein B0T16DRAFT_226563 [Cercophora newfieldiana]
MSTGWRGAKCYRRSNRHFVGRKGLLRGVHQCLRDGPARSEPVLCLLLGLAGIGKTEAALEYCHIYSQDYDWQFWVASGTHDELFNAFTRLRHWVPQSARVSTDAVGDVINWLETTGDSWIIVFDNVEDWTSLESTYLPKQCSGRSAVMFTSQLTALAPEADHVFQVESLSALEGAQLVERHVHGSLPPTPQEHDAALHISRRFGGFPLFLAHIGGFIRESASSIERHNRAFDVRHSFSWRGQTHATIQYSRPIETVWDFALSESQLCPYARNLVMVMSFLHSEGIPESIVLHSFKKDPASWRIAPGSEEARLLDVRRALHKRSLISIHRTPNQPNDDKFTMQRSLQHAILIQLDEDTALRATIFHQAFSVIRRATPKANIKQIPNPKLWPQFRIVAAHIVTLCRKFTQAAPPIQGTLEFAELLYDGGFSLWERQDYATTEDALLMLSTSLKIMDEVSYHEYGRLRADVRAIMGMCYDRLGPAFYEKALDIRKEARRIRQAINEQEAEDDEVSPTTERLLYNSLNDQGIAEMQRNQFHGAEPLFTECLRKYQRWGSEADHPFEYAKYYHNMGLVRMCQGNFPDAVNFLGKAVELEKLYEGAKSSPLISLFAYHFACVLFHAGDVKSALEKHLEILAQRELHSGRCSEPTLLSCYTVGAMYHHMGDLEKAEQYIKESIDRASSAEGEPWPEYARGRAHMHMAKVMRMRGATDEDVRPFDEVGNEILCKNREFVQPLMPRTNDAMILYDALQPVLHGRYTGQGLVPLLQTMATGSKNNFYAAGQ